MEGLASHILEKLGKAKPKAKETTPLKKKVLKRPAAAVVTPEKTAEVEEVAPLKQGKLGAPAFVGTARTGPCRWENMTIYTSDKAWRVRKEGDKKDKAFSFLHEDAQVVWKRLVAYCQGQL